MTSSNRQGEVFSFPVREVKREVKEIVEWRRLLRMHCCQAQLGLLKLKMDVLSEQEVKAGPSYASDSGESGVEKKSFEAEAEADTHSTPTERGGWALVFESRRQNEESLEEVIFLCNRLEWEASAMNELRCTAVDGCGSSNKQRRRRKH